MRYKYGWEKDEFTNFNFEEIPSGIKSKKNMEDDDECDEAQNFIVETYGDAEAAAVVRNIDDNPVQY
ncbi:hypothetical protein JTB14_030825 [Gonioctena quinquepunctata]|nr:hypothetical protein JTB14_030825 [Gonioctena quinquepunctata]